MAALLFSASFIAHAAGAAIRAAPDHCSTVNTSCSPNGAFLCNGPSQFGLCNWGSVIWQDVAEGTICQNGQIMASAELDPSWPMMSSQQDSPAAAATFLNYAPVPTQCPADQKWIRPATGLSEQEATWVQGRKVKVLDGLSSYLQRLHLDCFDVQSYINKLKCHYDNVPTIGMAISGGGYASAFTGVGAMRAFDDRFPDALEWRTGGILQSMTYLSGLSGGSWPVMSLATNNFPTVQDMVSGWHVNVSRPTLGNTTALAPDFQTIFQQLAPKVSAGYEVGMIEVLARGWAYEFVAGAKGGLNTVLSGIADLSNFKNHEMPFPTWQAAMAQTGDVEYYGYQVPFNTTPLFEMTPFEFGAWKSIDEGPEAFFPMKYLGTQMQSGAPVGDCIVGFDRASFVLALAADATNYWLIEGLSNDTLAPFYKRSEVNHAKTVQKRNYHVPVGELETLQKELKKYFGIPANESVYTTIPNPFAGTSSSKDGSSAQNLTLLDGSEMGQDLPLWGQLQPSRNLDLIIAWDNAEDAYPYAWNNGTDLHDTYVAATQAGLPFPIVPEPATFVNRNFTTTPVFFGCDANLTNTNDTQSPIVLYLANSPYSTYTNFSWTQLAFSNENMAAMMTNSGNIVTQGNSTLDAEWPECLGCAMIDRSLEKVGLERTEQCQRCMSRYCWDGVSDNDSPGVVDPSLRLDPAVTFEIWNQTSSLSGPFWGEYS